MELDAPELYGKKLHELKWDVLKVPSLNMNCEEHRCSIFLAVEDNFFQDFCRNSGITQVY